MLTVHAGRLVYLEEVDNQNRTIVRRELTRWAEEVFPPGEYPFLRAIAESGWGDDLPKLVYADWLDERSDIRGELIRVEVKRTGLPKGDLLRRQLARRRARLYNAADWVWIKALGFSLPRDKYGGLELQRWEWDQTVKYDRGIWDRELNDPVDE